MSTSVVIGEVSRAVSGHPLIRERLNGARNRLLLGELLEPTGKGDGPTQPTRDRFTFRPSELQQATNGRGGASRNDQPPEGRRSLRSGARIATARSRSVTSKVSPADTLLRYTLKFWRSSRTPARFLVLLM